MKKTSVLICIFLLFSFPAFGADYYVSKSGNDNNPGTEASPWLTLKKAGNSARAGDTVCFKAGVYKGPLRPMNSGTPDNYITFRTFGSDEVIIEGGYEVTGWSVHSGAIYKASWDSNWLKSEYSGISGETGYVNVDRIFDEDHWLKPITSLNEMVNGSWYYDISGKLLYVWLSDSSNPSTHTVLSTKSYYLSDNGIKIDRASYIKIYGFKVRMACFNIQVFSPQHHIEISNVEVFGGYDSIRLNKGASYVTLDNVNVHNNIGHGIQCNASYCTIKNSDIHHNGAVSWSRWGGCGIVLLGDNNTLKDCTIHGHGLAGAFGAGVALETWGTDGAAGPDTSHDNLVENNKIYGNTGQCGIYVTGADKNKIIRNIIHNNTYGIEVVSGGQGGSTTEAQRLAENNMIYNNTIANNSYSGITLRNEANGSKIINNIFYKNGSFELRIDSASSPNLNFNDYYNERGALFSWSGNSYAFDSYKTASGQDSNSIWADPKFVNGAVSDFSLLTGSSCIDKGTILGLYYSGSAPDMGAIESASSLNPPKDLRKIIP